MKKETVFDIGSPIEEMETPTYRTTQRGQPIPIVGGIAINPSTGYAVSPVTGQSYGQQPAYGNYIGVPINQVYGQPVNQQFTYGNHPVLNPPQTLYTTYGPGTTQPGMIAGATPGYTPNTFQNPYSTAQNPVTLGTYPGYNGANVPVTLFPVATGTPGTQPVWGNPLSHQGTGYYQPAVNVADGQYMLVPYQTPQSTPNYIPSSKNGDRDFVNWVPNVNIYETENTFRIELCVPGVTKETCRISIDKNNVLRISGTRRWNQETDSVGTTRKEFNYGSFARSFLLTENLLTDKITSSCRNGLLIINIPKEEESSETGYERRDSEISVN